MRTSALSRLVTALAAVALGAACVSLDDGSEDAEVVPGLEMSDLGGMVNVAVLDDVWLGGHASAEDLDLAKRRGIETVVDLGDAGTGRLDVAAVCAELGIEHEPAPLDPTVPSDTAVDRVLATLMRPERGAVLLLCDDGARCATVFAIYRVVSGGLALDDALEEARRVGLKPGTGEDAVRRQVERLTGSV